MKNKSTYLPNEFVPRTPRELIGKAGVAAAKQYWSDVKAGLRPAPGSQTTA